MNLFPAIDLIGGKAVRLIKGDYDQVTVYSDSPHEVARSFEADGARYLHLVDLEGARDGTLTNLETIKKIIDSTSLFVEVGGGIRNMDTVEKYIGIGASRVIIGTAAVTDPEFLEAAVKKYGEKIAVGVDVKDGAVAIKGWRETSSLGCFEFCGRLSELGVKTVICTDISKDGLLSGTNLELYAELSRRFSMDIVASGGVSSLDDVRKLSEMKLYGAILGKALYTGNVKLDEAIRVASEVDNGN
ncbi:MAG: 1-(5-phosphoribosyl)-5-[(5-phosphoribosylamino)methylideneamino]imidazole-4-carboxamide isomerase [Ruminococcaceae bacterium]|nr:1-(5-phosphoribosyl)-5-[(5-phosphoribosylamino)methylideneamino]imidazole-4-carboxamide isomerase [Oscillospiraceae bacterium]